MRVIMTGFQPFGDERTNPSEKLVKDLSGKQIAGAYIQTYLVPVTIQGIQQYSAQIAEEISNVGAVVIGLGLAGGRKGLAVERVAVNCFDFPITDNSGAQPVDTLISDDGPAAYFSSLPIKRIVRAWREAGIPGYVSNTAGTYICNGMFYLLRHGLRNSGSRAGFIHVPYTSDIASDASQPSMQYDTMLRGVEIAIRVVVENTDDVDIVGGTIC